MSDEGFLRRWSRRKIETRLGHEPLPEPPAEPQEAMAGAAPALAERPPLQAQPAPEATARAGVQANAAVPARAREAAAEAEAGAEHAAAAPSLPTMDDVATLTRDSDYSGFVARGVDPAVRRSALKKLFADPHFNTMDRLDIYMDDYNKPSPVSPEMLASLRHSARLFERVADAAAEAGAETVAEAGAGADAIPAQDPLIAAAVAADPAAVLPEAPPLAQAGPQEQQDPVAAQHQEYASDIPPETETR